MQNIYVRFSEDVIITLWAKVRVQIIRIRMYALFLTPSTGSLGAVHRAFDMFAMKPHYTEEH